MEDYAGQMSSITSVAQFLIECLYLNMPASTIYTRQKLDNMR